MTRRADGRRRFLACLVLLSCTAAAPDAHARPSSPRPAPPPARSAQTAAAAWFARGKAAAERRNFDGAVAAFRRAVRLEPGNAGYAVALAGAYRDVGRFTEALGVLASAPPATATPAGRKKRTLAEADTHFLFAQSLMARYRFAEAVKHLESAYRIDRVHRRDRAATDQNLLGVACGRLGRFEAAVGYYEQAAAILREIKDRKGEGAAVSNVGFAYHSLGRFEEAAARYERALAIARETGDRGGEGATLSNLGAVYESLGRYEQAIRAYEQAITVAHEVKNRRGEAVALSNLGAVYGRLSRHEQAAGKYERAVAMLREVKDRQAEGVVLNNLGLALWNLGRHEPALHAYRESLAIRREVKDLRGEAVVLNNLGEAYHYLGQYEQAAARYERALEIAREVQDRQGEGLALNNVGFAYQSLGRHEQAVGYLEQALAVLREVKHRRDEATALNNLMASWRSLRQPGLAAFYGKQSVNVHQSIRADIRGLDKESQDSYRASVEATYRDLADLLIEAGRLPEAQQVLGLLKEEEFFGFVRGDARHAAVLDGRADLTAPEKEAYEKYRRITDEVTALGERRGALRAVRGRTPAQEAELDAVEKQLADANQVFAAFLRGLPGLFGERSGADARPLAAVQAARAFSSDLKDLGRQTKRKAVAVYTLVGAERLRLIVATPDAQVAREFPIKAADLSRKVLQFRQALQNPRLDPRPLGKELYDILVAPIETDLKGAGADTLMWSLDGSLRYLPVAALHDGKQYLAERYGSSVFTLASNSRLKDDVSEQWQALGLGVSKAHEGFTALPGVKDEMSGIVRGDGGGGGGVLEGRVLLDESFTESALTRSLRDGYPVVHIASHFAFRPGDETDSFLLLGDGTRLTLDKIQGLGQAFEGVELLTLSACDTATGGGAAAAGGGNGREVESFAVLAQSMGAKAVMATLWPVADVSTQALMRAFYGVRQGQPRVIKAEALRLAQVALLRGQAGGTKAGGAGRGAAPAFAPPSSPGAPPPFTPDPKAPHAHPFYWAPFILIGNWK